MWSAGTARSPVRGDVDLEVSMSPDTGPASVIIRRVGAVRCHVAVDRCPRWTRTDRRRETARLRQTRRVLDRPPPGSIPDAPGSYQFRDRDGRVIYVGKAKSLRSRLSNYFQNPASLPPRTAQMVAQAESVEWIQVRNDVEALMLEYSLIKQHKPRFNVRLRDDKSYPFLAVTIERRVAAGDGPRGEPGTRAAATSGPTRTPTPSGRPSTRCSATFPIRHLQRQQVPTHQRLGKPCLLYHIEKCSGPCVG